MLKHGFDVVHPRRTVMEGRTGAAQWLVQKQASVSES